jgi:hypothetical protein
MRSMHWVYTSDATRECEYALARRISEHVREARRVTVRVVCGDGSAVVDELRRVLPNGMDESSGAAALGPLTLEVSDTSGTRTFMLLRVPRVRVREGELSIAHVYFVSRDSTIDGKDYKDIPIGVIFKSHSGVYTGTIRVGRIYYTTTRGIESYSGFDPVELDASRVVKNNSSGALIDALKQPVAVNLVGFPITGRITRISIAPPRDESLGAMYSVLCIWSGDVECRFGGEYDTTLVEDFEVGSGRVLCNLTPYLDLENGYVKYRLETTRGA